MPSSVGVEGIKGTTPTAAEPCAVHMKKMRSSIGALGRGCSSISTQAREGSGFTPGWSPAVLLLLLLLSYCETADLLDPKLDFIRNTFQITYLISSTVRTSFLVLLKWRWKKYSCLFSFIPILKQWLVLNISDPQSGTLLWTFPTKPFRCWTTHFIL